MNKQERTLADLSKALKSAGFKNISLSVVSTQGAIEPDVLRPTGVCYSYIILKNGVIYLAVQRNEVVHYHTYLTVNAFVDKLKTIDLYFGLRKELDTNDLL